MILSAPATSAQLGFTFQAGSVTGAVNTPAAVNIWERASNAALLRRQVGREGFREGGRIEICVAVRCFLDRIRLARCARKAFSVRCLGLTRIRFARRDKYEPDDMRVRSGLRVTVPP